MPCKNRLNITKMQ